jgi:hypothetical protein
VARRRFAPKLSTEHELGGKPWNVVLKHRSVRTRKSPCAASAFGISKAKHFLARDVAYLIRLCLVAENDGRLSLTDIGPERYRALPKAGMTAVGNEGEAAALVAHHVLGDRQR